MEIIRLELNDFCGHKKSEIDFNEFSSALILGSMEGDYKKSNGSGKSTIFSAIEYVLFNETRFSNLDKIIRNNCDVCSVMVDIKIQNEIYRIIRSRSRKSGTDLRLFKKNENIYEDITQRRITDTEKELSKLIKINYKTFISTVLFSQAKSDSQSRLDFSDLAAITPEKRKNALKEILQLVIYSKFEALTKKKISEITKDLEKNNIVLSTLGNPQAEINELKKEEEIIDNNINQIHTLLQEKNKKQEIYNNEFIEIKSKIELFEEQKKSLNNIKDLELEVNKLKNNINEYKNKSEEVKNNGKKLAEEIKELNNFIENNKIDANAISDLETLLLTIADKSMEKQVSIKLLKEKLKDLEIPLPDTTICKSCRQQLTEQHIKDCQKIINSDKVNVLSEINELENNYLLLNKEKSEITKKINSLKSIQNKLIETNQLLTLKNKEISNKRTLYAEYSSLLESLKKEYENKLKILNDLNNGNVIDFNEKINFYKQKEYELKNKSNTLSKEISELLIALKNIENKKAITDHRIKSKQDDLNKIKEINENTKKIEKSLILHQNVKQAFGSDGIPAFIVRDALNELQTKVNNCLFILRPEIQLQFVLLKGKEQEETLDINYFINKNELEYWQLSGAQKIIVALAIKLGLISLIKSKLGTEVRFLLLDEVDQALDEYGQDAFSDIIKNLQKDFKILVITHNNEFKHKFSNAILVEQNKDFISNARLVKGW